MHTSLSNTCFELVNESTFNVNKLTTDPNWQQQFLNMCHTCCDWTETTALENSNHLTRHIGSTSTYTHKQALITNLKIIYTILAHPTQHAFLPFSNTDQAKILAPLVSGLSECTEGFFNRSISTVRNFMVPKTLGVLMMRIRSTLVDEVARSISSDIHVHTHVFNRANHLGYGVLPINPSDTQRAQDSRLNGHLETQLQAHFESKFRPFFMINALTDHIKKILVFSGYTGKAKYTANDYNLFIEYLNTVLNAPIDYQYLVQNDANEVIDLDWFAIKKNLWSTLIEQGHIKHAPTMVNQLLDPLHVADDVLSSHLNTAFPDALDLIQLFQCFPELSSHAQEKILTLFITHHAGSCRQKHVTLIAPMLSAINHDSSLTV